MKPGSRELPGADVERFGGESDLERGAQWELEGGGRREEKGGEGRRGEEEMRGGTRDEGRGRGLSRVQVEEPWLGAEGCPVHALLLCDRH